MAHRPKIRIWIRTKLGFGIWTAAISEKRSVKDFLDLVSQKLLFPERMLVVDYDSFFYSGHGVKDALISRVVFCFDFHTLLLTKDTLAPTAMKTAVKREMACELQFTVNHRIVERSLHSFRIERYYGVYLFECQLLSPNLIEMSG